MPRWRLVFDGDNIYTEKVKRIHKLTQDIETKIGNIPGVVDSADSDSTTDALSAHMGKVLQDQIRELSGVWTFVSVWDCTTWLPVTNPLEDPYTYKQWNYYIVGKVASSGGTNYKPFWASYTQWVPSTAVETDPVSINDWYLYDGSTWVRQPAWDRAISIDSALSTTSTNAVENRVVTNALNWKQNTITDLQTIREWAAAWATAVQPWDNINTLTNNVWYQTAWDVANAIANASHASQSDLNALTTRVSNLETASWWAAQDIADIKSDISDLQSDVSWLQTDVSGLQSDVSALQTTVWWHTSSISTIQWNITTIQWDISTLQSSVASNTSSISTMQWSLSTLQQAVATNTSNITSLQTNKADKTYVDNRIQYVTQAEYDALPSSKLTDWVNYFIYTPSQNDGGS